MTLEPDSFVHEETPGTRLQEGDDPRLVQVRAQTRCKLRMSTAAMTTDTRRATCPYCARGREWGK